jgi:hypothetical protein
LKLAVFVQVHPQFNVEPGDEITGTFVPMPVSLLAAEPILVRCLAT